MDAGESASLSERAKLLQTHGQASAESRCRNVPLNAPHRVCVRFPKAELPVYAARRNASAGLHPEQSGTVFCMLWLVSDRGTAGTVSGDVKRAAQVAGSPSLLGP
jgi:hypothetical protein